MTLPQGFSKRRALAAAAASLELDALDGAGEGADALVVDRGRMWADGPWVLPTEPRAALTARFLDDRALLIAGEGYARVIDAQAGTVARDFSCEGGRTLPVLLSGHRRIAATCNAGVRVWDFTTGRVLWTGPTRAGARAYLAPGIDGSWFAVRDDGTDWYFDVARGVATDAGSLDNLLDGPHAREFLLDVRRRNDPGRWINDGRHRWPRLIAARPTSDERGGVTALRAQAVSDEWIDPGDVISAGETVRYDEFLWDLDAGAVRVALDLDWQTCWPELALSPDGRRVAHVVADGTAAQIWTLPTSRLRASARGARLDPLARRDVAERSGDGRVARFGDDETVSVFELGTNRRLATIAPPRDDRFVRAHFADGGRTLVTHSTLGWIDRWDLTPDDPRTLLREHLARTNLRVCRASLAVVAVPPPLDAPTAQSPWAPTSLCASASRDGRR